jgi:hypothetical protein
VINHQTPSRAELLKQLREAHRKSVEQTQALYKEQQLQNAICQLISQESKTVPQIAEYINKPVIRFYGSYRRLKIRDRRETGDVWRLPAVSM